MKYKGIIFDFNGVLLWDSEIVEKAWNKLAEQLRGKPLSQQELDTKMHGVPGQGVLAYLLGRSLETDEAVRFETKRDEFYMEMALEDPKKYTLSQGATSLLNFIVDKNIPHTIATSSPKLLVSFYEKQLHISRWFTLSKIIYNDHSYPGKPAPDIYLKAAKTIGVEPKDCIVIEDAVSGIAAAHAAGIGYIIAIGPKEKHESLEKLLGVKEVVATLAEVKKEELF